MSHFWAIFEHVELEIYNYAIYNYIYPELEVKSGRPFAWEWFFTHLHLTFCCSRTRDLFERRHTFQDWLKWELLEVIENFEMFFKICKIFSKTFEIKKIFVEIFEILGIFLVSFEIFLEIIEIFQGFLCVFSRFQDFFWDFLWDFKI